MRNSIGLGNTRKDACLTSDATIQQGVTIEILSLAYLILNLFSTATLSAIYNLVVKSFGDHILQFGQRFFE